MLGTGNKSTCNLENMRHIPSIDPFMCQAQRGWGITVKQNTFTANIYKLLGEVNKQ